MSEKLTPERVAGRKRGAEIVQGAIEEQVARGNGACTLRALSKRPSLGLGYSDIQRRQDPKAGVGFHLGDLLGGVLPFELALDIARRVVAELEAREGDGIAPMEDPRGAALELVDEVGACARAAKRAMHDKHFSTDEAAEVEALMASAERSARRGKLAARAAKERGRR